MPKKNKTSTGRPIVLLLDLLGKRWTLRILWELRDGPMTFRQLQERCDDVSPTSLNTRLKELRENQLVQHRSGGFEYTSLGIELSARVLDLAEWSGTWAKKISSI
jgi:DNA-binding HxlR family transcriptional regulator